jgi:hypothetical protein
MFIFKILDDYLRYEFSNIPQICEINDIIEDDEFSIKKEY